MRLPIIESYNDALAPIFLYIAPLAIAAAILLCFLRVVPLATTIERDIPAESLAEGQLFGAPESDESEELGAVDEGTRDDAIATTEHR
ncbi:hypothetical protein [Nocardioides sp.]|uniref:hypothetical protein n=1 Tax=Nocardioides sp. TaxID=35761 RepID=UPI00262D11D3|nr:hypothetical protein [Nocardioides sp.]MDI6909503.1 hypothetical protein [Nocardioides sp.]